MLPRSDGAAPYPFAATQFDEFSAVLSPDGRWIAYVTLESGICEVVVQSFADPAAGKWQISANGGFAPRWSPDGRELYYFDGVESVVRVEVATEPAFHVGKPFASRKHRGVSVGRRQRRSAVAADLRRRGARRKNLPDHRDPELDGTRRRLSDVRPTGRESRAPSLRVAQARFPRRVRPLPWRPLAIPNPGRQSLP